RVTVSPSIVIQKCFSIVFTYIIWHMFPGYKRKLADGPFTFHDSSSIQRSRTPFCSMCRRSSSACTWGTASHDLPALSYHKLRYGWPGTGQTHEKQEEGQANSTNIRRF